MKSNTEDFIKKAKAIHGNKYDYSKVEYINTHTKIIIICPVHGAWEQQPYNHLMKKGCPKCGGNSKSNTEEFIQKSKIVHGDKYDYSKVSYINNSTDVIIICPEHGEFKQNPASHMEGKKCGKCAGTYMDTKYFKEKAKKVHGNKYDYSKVNYISQKFKVIIMCSKHGEFEQNPTSHLRGAGCIKCAGMKKLTTEEFIQKSKIVHGDKYNYSKVEYVGTDIPIIIICPEHGEFKQSPYCHLKGNNCPKCVGGIKITQEQFIKKAKAIHDDKYDYSKVNYISTHKKVIIICKEHGEFLQAPADHQQTKGCPKCSGTYMDTEYFKEKAIKIHGNKYDYSKVIYEKNNKKVIIICPEHGDFEQNPSEHLSGKGCAKCQGFGFTYRPLNEVKIIIQPLMQSLMKMLGKRGITQEDYFKWWEENEKFCRENGIPRNPRYVYNSK